MYPETIKLPENPRILVARTDRIGDVVLSLPVFASLRATYPGAWICALTRDYTRGLLLNRDDVDEVISFPSENAHIPGDWFWKITRELKSRKFDLAVALYLNFSVGAALALARVPVRIGPATKIAQLTLTHGIRQRRSKSSRHEADHNLDLLKPLGAIIKREARIAPPEGARKFFDKAGGRPLVGIHPGHGGSSKNWPERSYARLAAALADSGLGVVLTGAPAEEELLERLAREHRLDATIYIGRGGIMELASALSELDVYVASSTGPLHMASALGVPVVGIYCPIIVCLPRRWGPIGPNDTAITPEVAPCGACDGSCGLEEDCMETIDVEEVKKAVLSKIKTAAEA